MKKLFMVLPLVFLLCFAFSCQQGEEVAEEPGVKPLSDEDIAANKALTAAYVQGINSKDWAAVTVLYTEDAILMPPNQPLVQGREAILVWAEAFPPLTEFDLTLVEIDGYGDLAYVRGMGTMTMTPESAPEPIKDTVKYIEIRRKQDDGSWLIAIDIMNSDLPLPVQPEKE
jgi:uncharacterized protein (TIGR02246 family)